MRALRYLIVTSSGASGTYLMYVSKAAIIFFWYSGMVFGSMLLVVLLFDFSRSLSTQLLLLVVVD